MALSFEKRTIIPARDAKHCGGAKGYGNIDGDDDDDDGEVHDEDDDDDDDGDADGDADADDG